jgi:hypothetical protein
MRLISKRGKKPCMCRLALPTKKHGSGINGGAIIDHEAPRERRFVAVEK